MADDSIFKHALQLWSAVEFPKLQKELDATLIEIKSLEEQSLSSRKLLASETKRFKRLEESEKLVNINKIIKKYQNEIDSLTSRSKYSEQVLFRIYSKFSETPDPKFLLESIISQIDQKNETLAIKQQNIQLSDRLSKIADYDKIKSRLLNSEQEFEKRSAKQLATKEQEINARWVERSSNWESKEKELYRQLESLKNSNKVLEKKLSEQINLNILNDSDAVKDKSAKDYYPEAELNLLTQELESSQLRVLDLEKRNEDLNMELAKANNSLEHENQLHTKESKINELECENALLTAALERERISLKNITKENENKVENISRELITYKNELDIVRRKLDNFSDYKKIKEELTTLKRIEFGADEDSDTNSDNVDNDVDLSLLNANKKLQSNLAELRNKISTIESEKKELNIQIEKLSQKATILMQTNSKLEKDLENIEDVSKFSDSASMASRVTRQITNRTSYGNGKLSPTSSIIGIPEDTELPPVMGNTSAILPIVTQQRDRFRNKNVELERKLKHTSLNQIKLQAEISGLKVDNQKLYERIRFISSYNRNLNPNLLNIKDNVEAQYINDYEESLHPLADFKQRELERYQKKRMSPLEKLFLSFAKIVLANKTSRMLFMFYCVGLHGLVMMMSLYVVSLISYQIPTINVAHAAGGLSTKNVVPK